MRKARLAALAAMSSLALFPAVAEASTGCWYPNEARSAQLRGLQTMLMVGTLQCRRSHSYTVDLYNDFVVNQRPFLDANSYILKGRFMRENGISGGQGAYDSFTTSLANRYSEKLDNRTFCETVANFARLAAKASRRELFRLADSVAEAPGSRGCPASNYRFDPNDEEANLPDYARRHEPPPAPRIAIVETAPAPAPVPVKAAEALPAPVKAVEALPAPVEAAAALPAPAAAEGKEALIQKAVSEAAPPAAPAPIPAAAPAQPAREEALQAAIVALQSAVSALQAVSAPAPAAAAGPTLVKVAEAPVVPPEEIEHK